MSNNRSITSLFATDENLEKTGFVVDYGDYGWFRVARAGGANVKFTEVTNRLMRPHRRAVENGSIAESVATKIRNEALAEGVILEWGHPAFADDENPLGSGKMIFVDPEDTKQKPTEEILEFSVENVVRLLKALPDLAVDLQQQAMNIANFRSEQLEQDAKN